MNNTPKEKPCGNCKKPHNGNTYCGGADTISFTPEEKKCNCLISKDERIGNPYCKVHQPDSLELRLKTFLKGTVLVNQNNYKEILDYKFLLDFIAEEKALSRAEGEKSKNEFENWLMDKINLLMIDSGHVEGADSFLGYRNALRAIKSLITTYNPESDGK